jgi:hypothetical protein
MSNKMRVVITSDTEREDLFAELWYDDEQWAEITADTSSRSFRIEIFAPHSPASYVFPLADLQQAIEEAKGRLVAMGYPRGTGVGVSRDSVPVRP